ncbi:MAG: hypothetical protein HY650_08445 [Acidobacteria bacterium]|nr:hypothetical protein [Acidobacteriota bacterium]
MTLFLAFLIGVFAGLRSLTAPAATAWAAYLGWLRLERPLALIGSLPAALIITVALTNCHYSISNRSAVTAANVVDG